MKVLSSPERKTILPVVFLFVVLFPPTAALAQPAASGADPWQFGVSIYGWFPDIAGETSFTQPGDSSEFKIEIEDILDNLEFTLMGTFDVRKNRWGILNDFVYMDVGKSETGTRDASIGGRALPANATADVDLDLESWIWTIAGYYQAFDQSGLKLDLLAGTRHFNAEQAVDWVITGNIGSIPIPDRAGKAKANLSNWDAVIGVRGRIALGDNIAWYVPYYIDLGTGESDLTWQGMTGLGYAFHWLEIAAVWRYLYFDLPSGKAIEDINFGGPAIGATFRW